ncbi:MAG: 50S ribosomal protein L4 [Rhodothermales bacterium]|nr:50S ribosomal protein L4 [Rhodothermales bacterium]MBO6781422.1 50S ribosomal protein L4 [Rhodothermales bacterium]
MKTKVLKLDGSETGRTADLDQEIFGIDPNDHAIWLDVRRIQAHARQGTHKTKERSETAGSTRKLYRQKGTGHARAGDAKSPLRRSGGTTFGPKPHEYRLKVNKKTRQLARRSAYSHKARAEALRVVENFNFEGPSTSQLRQLIRALEADGRSVLLVTDSHNPAVYQSGRNLKKVTVRAAGTASTADVIGAQVVILQEAALSQLSSALGAGAKDKANAE